MKGRIETRKRFARRWTVTKREMIWNSLQRNTHAQYSNSKFFSFFLVRFKLQIVCLPPGKILCIWTWIFLFLCSLSWKFCWLLLRGIQIWCWISSSVFLKNVAPNLLSHSKLWWTSLFFSAERIPSLGFSVTFTPFLWDTERISRISSRHNSPNLAEWSGHCLANCH